MKTNFENSNWKLQILGDHALVFSLKEKMSVEIIEKIIALKKTIQAYHFNFINIDASIEKYKTYSKRLSQENIKMGWGNHYSMSEEKIRSEFYQLRKNAIKLFTSIQ